MILSFLLACASHLSTPASAAPVFDLVLIPGCPSRPDGSLSTCQWRRALWAAELYERGEAEHFVTSGAAVYTPYVEAEALAEAMVELGVPRRAITLESRALHSDENLLYTAEIVRERQAVAVAVASDGPQTRLIRQLALEVGLDIQPIPLDNDLVMGRIFRGLPALSTEAVTDWQPLEEREDRPGSGRVYARMLRGQDTEGALSWEAH
jgi:uncharacterized SAM-binding protein YcdF (DUF218 family)